MGVWFLIFNFRFVVSGFCFLIKRNIEIQPGGGSGGGEETEQGHCGETSLTFLEMLRSIFAMQHLMQNTNNWIIQIYSFS